MGECYQWKVIGQCSKGDSCSFSHDPASGNRREQIREGQSSSPAPKAKAQTDGKIASKSSGRGGESPSGIRGKIPCRYFLGGKCTYQSCNFGHPAMCLNYKSESGCKYGDKCRFRHVEADRRSSKTSKKSDMKRSVALLKDAVQLGCVSQDSHPNTSVARKERKIGIKSHRQILQGHVAPHQTSGKKGSITRSFFKSVRLMSAIRVRQSLRKGHKTKPCNKKDAPAE